MYYYGYVYIYVYIWGYITIKTNGYMYVYMYICGWWFQTWLFFPFHIRDVIRNPLTNSIIFQDG